MSKETRVINKYKEDFDVYIGRGSKYGNPFVLGKDGSRSTIIRKFREYFKEMRETEIITDEELRELKGKRLGCFCKPKPCHGDVIKAAVDELED